MQTAEAQNEAPKIEPVFDEDEIPTGKLDDVEIARLVSLSSQAVYHRTEDIPVKPRESFQPRTLVTIAMEAQRRREAELEESASQETKSTFTLDNSEVTDTAELSSDALTGDISTETPKEDAVTETADAATMANEEVSLLNSGELEADEVELSEEEIAANALAEKLHAEYERGLTEGRAEGEEAGHKAGHNKGYEAGRAAGQAEATAQLETAIKGFEKATLALASSAALDLDALTASINETILSLASERSGMAIAEMPEGFASRIEAILSTIKQGSDHPQITLNPDDLVSLKPIIATREKLQKCSLDADDNLASGDIRLVIGGIGIDDELRRRVSGKTAVKPAGVLTEEVSPLAVDTKTDAAEPKPTGPTIGEPAGGEPAVATSTSDVVSEVVSTSSEVKSEGGFSIGLKPIAKTDAPPSSTAEDANDTGFDKS